MDEPFADDAMFRLPGVAFGSAVGLRADHGFGCEIVACTRAVLDDELLPEPLRQPVAEDTRQNVGGTARRITDDDARIAVRIIRSLRRRRERGR